MVFQDTPKIVYRTILANHHSHVTSQQTFAGLQNVLKTSSRHVLKKSSTHVLKMSSTHLQLNNFSSFKTSSRRLENVLKTSCKYVLKTSWRRFQDISEDILKTSWRRLEDVFGGKKLLRWGRLEDVLKVCLEDVLMLGQQKRSFK